MKVLFLLHEAPDYLSNCLLHGLYQILGADLTHYPSCDLMYKCRTSPDGLKQIYGRGFTIWGLLPEYLNDLNDLPGKLKRRYFDLVIYGSVWRCCSFFDQVVASYKPSEIALVDGEDSVLVRNESLTYPYFKRELQEPGLYPISFSIPAEKIVSDPKSITKKIKLAKMIPGGQYLYDNEADYYNGYREAYFGMTTKKAGWDCMRHYEIMANFCMPYFPDLSGCPEQTMVNFPKELVLKGNKLFTDAKEGTSEYNVALNEVFKYLIDNLTTVHSAKYLLDAMIKLRK